MKNLILALLTLLPLSAQADPPAVHGMLLFGEKTLYASHLPMFHAPHDYQAIFEIGLADIPRSMTLQHYQQEKAAGQTLFTIVPQPMDLVPVMAGKVTNFDVSLYSGHFEQGGKRLGWVKLEVKQVVLAQKLNPNSTAANDTYFVFGKGWDYYAAHLIAGKPNFDAILWMGKPKNKFAPPCNRRLCPEEPVILPPGSNGWIMQSEASGVPEKGNFLGSQDLESQVLEVIYSDSADLSH